MHPTRRAVWVGTFDREPFIASILRIGTLLSLGLIVVGWTWGALTNQYGLQPDLQGTNVLQLLTAELSRVSREGNWPTCLLHLGIAVLLLIPLGRVATSAWYFAYVERHRAYTAFTVCVALWLAYILLFG